MGNLTYDHDPAAISRNRELKIQFREVLNQKDECMEKAKAVMDYDKKNGNTSEAARDFKTEYNKFVENWENIEQANKNFIDRFVDDLRQKDHSNKLKNLIKQRKEIPNANEVRNNTDKDLLTAKQITLNALPVDGITDHLPTAKVVEIKPKESPNKKKPISVKVLEGECEYSDHNQ
ncbi:hypothetical protein [Aquimarina algiphila]|uniref:hypothetical protein n=1 Tax=Aquimarina algiphila TaxID=2047982 RepID=UPI0023302C9D|nr:hypothetical protein [Aquimarina algiphila]